MRNAINRIAYSQILALKQDVFLVVTVGMLLESLKTILKEKTHVQRESSYHLKRGICAGIR